MFLRCSGISSCSLLYFQGQLDENSRFTINSAGSQEICSLLLRQGPFFTDMHKPKNSLETEAFFNSDWPSNSLISSTV